MPDEIVLIVIVAIVFGTVTGMVSNYLKYRSHRVDAELSAKHGTGSEGGSLKTSELEALIQAAVAQAIGPMEDEMRRIRRALRRSETPSDAPHALGAAEPMVDADLLDLGEDEDDALEPARRSRTRA